LNLGQLVKIAPKLKQYLIHNFLSTKPSVPKLALVHVITRPPKLQPTPCKMENQTIAKSIGLIHDLRILVHGIPYNVTFTIVQNSVLDCTYSMHLG
jgi:hypothetical protein